MYREEVTERSWRLLQKLGSELSFVVIGGWGVYFYTRRLKSKDIEVAVDLGLLDKLKARYEVRKNSRLKKYEFTVDGVDVHTYVPFFSDLGIPVEELLRETREIEGFRVPKPELLLATKQAAEIGRRGSDKGLKDRIDVLSLLLLGDLDLVDYARLLASHGLEAYLRELRSIVVRAKYEMTELGFDDPGKVKRLKRELISKIDAAPARHRPKKLRRQG
ncbi:MAG: hypothetical protein KGI38_11250 [Thaumarchaeota archaeon]|nr:hypothetical protein [Nitrososphaerota archaeon]